MLISKSFFFNARPLLSYHKRKKKLQKIGDMHASASNTRPPMRKQSRSKFKWDNLFHTGLSCWFSIRYITTVHCVRVSNLKYSFTPLVSWKKALCSDKAAKLYCLFCVLIIPFFFFILWCQVFIYLSRYLL